jgi:hypothetical protein
MPEDDLISMPPIGTLYATAGIVTSEWSATVFLEEWMRSYDFGGAPLSFDGTFLPWPIAMDVRTFASTPGMSVIVWDNPIPRWRVADGGNQILYGRRARCFLRITPRQEQERGENATPCC